MVEIDFKKLLIAKCDAEERVEDARKRAEKIIRKAQEEAEKIVKMKIGEKTPYEEENLRMDLLKRLEEFRKFIDENRESIRRDILMRTLGVEI